MRNSAESFKEDFRGEIFRVVTNGGFGQILISFEQPKKGHLAITMLAGLSRRYICTIDEWERAYRALPRE
jgi:hypothetical protein